MVLHAAFHYTDCLTLDETSPFLSLGFFSCQKGESNIINLSGVERIK